jgi:hypothetical protein
MSMTVAKDCVSRHWIVPFLKSRIHYVAARRSCNDPAISAHTRFLARGPEGRRF